MSRLIFNEQSSAPSSPSSGKVAVYVDNTGTPVLKMKDDAATVTNFLDSSRIDGNASTAAVPNTYASDTYLAGSSVIIPAGTWVAGATYYCCFDMVKTGAGTAAFTTIVRMGTAGTVGGDAAILTLAFAVGTGVIDTGLFEVWVNFRSIGSGTSAVIAGLIKCQHHLAATGLTTTGASGTAIILGTSSGFNSTTQTTLGLSINGGASFSGTNTIVQASLVNIT